MSDEMMNLRALIEKRGSRGCDRSGLWGEEQSERQRLEVLHVAARRNSSRAPEASQPHALEAVVNFQVGKAHLDAFALADLRNAAMTRRCDFEVTLLGTRTPSRRR